MKFWTVVILVICSNSIELGSLDGFLTVSEVTDRMNNLTQTYPDILIRNDGNSGFGTLLLWNSSANSNYYKPKALIFGGLSAGYPMGAFQVLHVAEVIASLYMSGNSTIRYLVDTHRIYFVPILNYAGYYYMENNYNGTFPVVKTGLEGNSSCIGDYDVGINPDHSFPVQWGNYGSSYCTNDYDGDSALQSNISNSISLTYYADSDVKFLINYQGFGKTYATPYAYTDSSLTNASAEFYQSIENYVPNGYSYGSDANISQSTSTGRLLDFAFYDPSHPEYGGSGYAFQVGLGEVPNIASDLIGPTADENFEFVVSTMEFNYPEIDFDLDEPEETKCKDSCNGYSTVEFFISLTNEHGQKYIYDLIFTAGFLNTSDYELINVTVSHSHTWSDQETIVLTPNNADSDGLVKYSISDSVPEFSKYKISFFFNRKFENSTTDYDIVANFNANPSGAFVNPKNLTLSGSFEEKSDHKSKRGIIVGLILLIILVILTFIAGVVLCCTRKNQENLAENPRMPYPDASRA